MSWWLSLPAVSISLLSPQESVKLKGMLFQSQPSVLLIVTSHVQVNVILHMVDWVLLSPVHVACFVNKTIWKSVCHSCLLRMTWSKVVSDSTVINLMVCLNMVGWVPRECGEANGRGSPKLSQWDMESKNYHPRSVTLACKILFDAILRIYTYYQFLFFTFTLEYFEPFLSYC